MNIKIIRIRGLQILVLILLTAYAAGCSRTPVIITEEVYSREADDSSSDVTAETKNPDTGTAGSILQTELQMELQMELQTDPQTTVLIADAVSAAENGQDDSAGILVHVCGAVISPGVYKLQEGDRIIDAVLAAGGFAEEADQSWCNQAMALCDGDKLRIYTLAETYQLREQGITPEADYSGITSAGAGGSGSDTQETQLVNLNTASVETLTTLPGIGEVKAKDIISYRNKHGAFTSKEQIMEVGGIKNSLYSRICDLITV